MSLISADDCGNRFNGGALHGSAFLQACEMRRAMVAAHTSNRFLDSDSVAGPMDFHCDPLCFRVLCFTPFRVAKWTHDWKGPANSSNIVLADLHGDLGEDPKLPDEAGVKARDTCKCSEAQIMKLLPLFRCYDCMWWFLDVTNTHGYKE